MKLAIKMKFSIKKIGIRTAEIYKIDVSKKALIFFIQMLYFKSPF